MTAVDCTYMLLLYIKKQNKTHNPHPHVICEGFKQYKRREHLCPSDEPDTVGFHHLKLAVVYERNNFRVPHKFIKVQCVNIAIPESQRLWSHIAFDAGETDSFLSFPLPLDSHSS